MNDLERWQMIRASENELIRKKREQDNIFFLDLDDRDVRLSFNTSYYVGSAILILNIILGLVMAVINMDLTLFILTIPLIAIVFFVLYKKNSTPKEIIINEKNNTIKITMLKGDVTLGTLSEIKYSLAYKYGAQVCTLHLNGRSFLGITLIGGHFELSEIIKNHGKKKRLFGL